MRWGVIVAALALLVSVRSASAQPAPTTQPPTTVDADVIIYDAVQQVITAEGNVRSTFRQYRLWADAARFDLRTGVVVATGRIRLTDALGRELRGQMLVYNTRTDEGVLEPVEGFLERRVYLRGTRLEVTPMRFVTHESTVTTCNPQRPLYRVVARRIEFIPDEEIVAYQASVYLGDRRLITLPRYVVSLRSPEESTQFPGFGTNGTDGLWIDYRFPLRLDDSRGQVYLKYGTQSGLFALLTLTHRNPAFSTTLRLGRTQTVDDRSEFNLLRYDVVEVSAATPPVRIPSTPLSWSLSASAGWYTELFPGGLSTSRVDGKVSLSSDRIALGPRLGFITSAAFRVSNYGTGDVRTITSAKASLAYLLDPHTTVTLEYSLVEIRGPQPQRIDNVEPASTIGLGVFRAVPDRYRIAASVAYNAAFAQTELAGAVGVILSPRWEVGVSVLYNTRLAAFENIDYMVRYICDCIDIIVRYRQVQREISLEFGLTGFTQPTGPVVPRTRSDAPQPPP
ncbi:MAG: LPS-assembly protein LptD [Armatimonadetes bacterium]|nr:LPS-assembly protein LptD [Armatimonadota bacterium]